MMYINQNPFSLNELIVSSGSASFQNNQPGFSLLQGNVAANSFQQQKPNSLYQSPINTFGCTATTSNVQTNAANNNLPNNRSTSVSSTGSSSSVSSQSSSSSSSTTSTSASPASYNKLANNIYPYNFAYYNPTITPTFTANTSSNQTKFASGSQLLPNTGLSTSTVLTNPTGLGTCYNQLNEKFIYRPKTDINNGILSNLNSYQLNVLSQKNQFHYNSQTAASIVNNDSNINGTNLLLFNTTKNAQNKQSYYNSHYEPIAYLPTGTDLFFTSPTVDQSPFSTSYLTTPSFTYSTQLAQQALAGTKPLIHSASFSAKTPFTATSVGINIKKRKRRFKKPLELRKVLPKNSLMLLHEYRPNVEYRFVCQSGPIHRPIFTMCVEINEHKFEGEGKTKKEARMAAAEKAIEFLMQNPEYIQKSVSHSSSASVSPAEAVTTDQDSTNNDEDDDDEENENENDDENALSNENDEDDEEEESKRFKRDISQGLNVDISKESNLKIEIQELTNESS